MNNSGAPRQGTPCNKETRRFWARKVWLALFLFYAMAHPVGTNAQDKVVLAVIPADATDLTATLLQEVASRVELPIVTVLTDRVHGDAGAITAARYRTNVQAILAMGRGALRNALAATTKIPIVLGGLAYPPAGDATACHLRVVSTVPTPEAVFETLKTIAPGPRHVWVVYRSPLSDSYIDAARNAARRAGMRLRALPVYSAITAAQRFGDALSEAVPHVDVILILPDLAGGDQTLLSVILQKAWQRSLLTMAMTAGDVQRGALVGPYINERQYGTAIVTSIQHQLAAYSQPCRGTTHHAPEVATAINLRTARHLGINVPDPGAFTQVFPTP